MAKKDPEKTRKVVALREAGYSYREIGSALRVSKQRAHQLYWASVNLWRRRVLAASKNPEKTGPGTARLPRLAICAACGEELRQVEASLHPALEKNPLHPPEDDIGSSP